jgi:hypothetical protein
MPARNALNGAQVIVDYLIREKVPVDRDLHVLLPAALTVRILGGRK